MHDETVSVHLLRKGIFYCFVYDDTDLLVIALSESHGCPRQLDIDLQVCESINDL